MKRYFSLIIFLTLIFLVTSCEKKRPLNENFIGTYKVIKRFPTTETKQFSTISAGKEDELLIWKVDGLVFNLEIYETSPDRAHHTNFSVPIFLDMSSSLTRINKDTIEGHYTIGSIFLWHYKSENFYLVEE